jgi:hypothetical protein
MIIGLGFSAVAVTISANSQSSTIRDQDRKDALAIAESGAERALFNYNKITTTSASPCVVKTGSGGNATLAAGTMGSSNPFCSATGGATDSDAYVGNRGGYWTYWVNPCVGQLSGATCAFPSGNALRTIEIVAQGTQRGVTRRVSVTASGNRGLLTNTNAKAIGLDGITMSGWSELEVDAATNGDFEMLREGGCPGEADGQGGLGNGSGCPRVCIGDWGAYLTVTVGESPHDLSYPTGTQGCTIHDPGRANGNPNEAEWGPRVNPPGPPEVGTLPNTHTVSQAEEGTQTVLKHNGNLSLAPVDMSGVDPNGVNGNQRLQKINQAGGDTSTGPGTINWDQSTRTLTMNGTGDLASPLVLNVGGTDYSLCKLVMTGYSQLIMTAKDANQPDTAARLFFDSPEHCGLSGNPVTQLSVHGYSKIGAASYRSFEPNLNLVLPLFAMVGSPSIATKADFQIPVSWPDGAVMAQQMRLYAPRSAISLDTGYSRENEGWFVGKTLAMIHGSEIESNPNMPPVGVGIVPPDYVHFARDSFVECGPPAASGVPIDAHCQP